MIGRTLDDCGIQWKHPDIGGEIAHWLRTEGVYRCDELHHERDGRVRSLGLTVRPIIAPQKGVTGFIITGADITERNNAAAALTHLAAIVEATDSAIIGADLEGRILNWNAAAERIHGYSLEEMKGRPVSVLWPPECGSEFAEVLRRLNLGESVEHVESVRVRKSGERIPVLITYSPIRDGSGKVVGTCSVAVDITERKLLERQLAQAQKLESIGQLAAGIAHEINTPIQYVSDNTRFLRDAFAQLDQLLQGYDRFLAAAPHGAPLNHLVAEIQALADGARLSYLRGDSQVH